MHQKHFWKWLVWGCLSHPTPLDSSLAISYRREHREEWIPFRVGRFGFGLSLKLCKRKALYRLNHSPGFMEASAIRASRRSNLKSRRPFVPAAQKLPDSLTESDTRAAQWMDYVWNMEYLKSASRLHAFIPRASPKPFGMGLPRTSWVKLNRLRTGVGQFHSCMYSTNGVLLFHRIVSVVPVNKLQTTSFLHAPYIVHQKEYKVSWSWMMTPDAGLKSTPSTSKPSEEDAQPHDDDELQKTAQMAEWYRASVSWAVDSGLIPSRVKPMTLKLLFTASLLDAQHYRDSMENKPASILVPLRKALSGISPCWCGRQMAGNS